MSADFIAVNTPLLDGNERAYLNECIDSGWISSEGPFVRRLESELAEYVGRKHGVATSSGSAALDIAVDALRLEPGDEVIIPTFTIISCAAPLVRRGLVPVCVDCDGRSYTMKTDDLEALVTPRTKAIMAVHIYGLPVDMDAVLRFARAHQLRVIEDAAQAHGLMCGAARCGSFGDISIFSFYPNKHLTTGEGGMVLTDDDELAQRCRSLRNLCFQPGRRFVHEDLGFNYRMSNVQAAIGCAQFERLDEFLEKKRRMGRRYTQAFEAWGEYVQLPLDSTDYAQNGYWVYPLVLSGQQSAEAFMALLSDAGVGTRPFFYPMHQQPVFQRRGLFNGVSLPVSERIAWSGLYIPSGLGLSDDEQDRVIKRVGTAIGATYGC